MTNLEQQASVSSTFTGIRSYETYFLVLTIHSNITIYCLINFTKTNLNNGLTSILGIFIKRKSRSLDGTTTLFLEKSV